MNISEILGITIPIGASVAGAAYMLLREVHSANIERDKIAQDRIGVLERQHERFELRQAQSKTDIAKSAADIQKLKRAILRIPTDVFSDSDEGGPSSRNFKETLY
jgi:hypothetical protein